MAYSFPFFAMIQGDKTGICTFTYMDFIFYNATRIIISDSIHIQIKYQHTYTFQICKGEETVKRFVKLFS